MLENAFSLRLSLGDDVGMVDTLEGMAGVALAEDHPLRATRLWGAVEVLRESIGAPRTPADMPSYNSALATFHSQLGEPRFEAAYPQF